MSISSFILLMVKLLLSGWYLIIFLRLIRMSETILEFDLLNEKSSKKFINVYLNLGLYFLLKLS